MGQSIQRPSKDRHNQLTCSKLYEKRVRVLVCFGDIRGFSAWEQSLTDPDAEFLPLMNRFEELIHKFGEKESYFVKSIADGFLAVMELESGHNCKQMLRFLDATWTFGKKIQRLISEHPWPRPDGFRIRYASGHVWKRNCKRGVDYVGRHINMAHKLLRVEPPIPAIAHRSVSELCTPRQAKKNHFRFTKLIVDRRLPDGLTRHDMECLYRLDRTKK